MFSEGDDKKPSCLSCFSPFPTPSAIRLEGTKLDACQSLKLCFISYNFLLISFVDKVLTSDSFWTCLVCRALEDASDVGSGKPRVDVSFLGWGGF